MHTQLIKSYMVIKNFYKNNEFSTNSQLIEYFKSIKFGHKKVEKPKKHINVELAKFCDD